MSDIKEFLEGEKELDEMNGGMTSHQWAQEVYDILEEHMLNNERRYELDFESMDQRVASSGRIRMDFEVAEFEQGQVSQFNPFELVIQGTEAGNEPMGRDTSTPVVELDLKVRTSAGNKIVEQETLRNEPNKQNVIDTFEGMLIDYGISI